MLLNLNFGNSQSFVTGTLQLLFENVKATACVILFHIDFFTDF